MGNIDPEMQSSFCFKFYIFNHFMKAKAGVGRWSNKYIDIVIE